MCDPAHPLFHLRFCFFFFFFFFCSLSLPLDKLEIDIAANCSHTPPTWTSYC